MNKILFSIVVATLFAPASAISQDRPGNQPGSSLDKRQDTVKGRDLSTRGECERAAQRYNAENNRDNLPTRARCVEENGTYRLDYYTPDP